MDHSEVQHEVLKTALQRTWQDSPGALPQFWYVSAPSGLGKSHLLRAVREAEHRQVAVTLPGLLPALTGAFHEPLSAGRQPALVSVWRAARPDLKWPALAGAPRDVPETEVLDALTGTLCRAAQAQGGWMLVVDEAERATPDDLRLLQACWRAACLHGAPVLLIVAGQEAQPAWLRDIHLTASLTPGAEVHGRALAPLDGPGMQAFVREALGPADAHYPAWLLSRSGGHPLWAAQLTGHLRAGGALRPEAGVWTFTPPPLEALPGSLAALLRSRWTALRTGEAGDDVLDLLAIAQTPVPLLDLQAMTQRDEDALRRLIVRLQGQGAVHLGLASGTVTVSLTHPSLGEVGRQALSAGQEARLLEHLITRSADPHVRARYARQAAHPDAGALTSAALAAARRVQAPALIAEHAGALLAMGPGRDHPALVKDLGLAQARLGAHRDAVQTLAQLGGQDAEVTEAHVNALMNLGEYQAGLTLLDSWPAPLPAALEVRRARLYLHLGRMDDVIPLLDALLTLPEVNLAQAHLARAHHALLAHDAPRLAQEAGQALTHAGNDTERADALNYAALAQSWLGEFDAAQAAYAECLTLLRRTGREASMQAVYGNLANLHLTASRFREAQEAQATCLTLARAGGTPLIEMNATGALGMTLVMLGDERGLPNVQAWQAHYQAHVPAGAPYVTLHAANAHALFGHVEQAAAYLDLFEESSVTTMGYGPLTLAQVYLMLGRTGDASRVLQGAPEYTGDPVGELQRPLVEAQILAVTGAYSAAERVLDQHRAHPQITRFPSIQAEYDWLLLTTGLRTGKPEQDLRALGARVLAFLKASGGQGFLRLTDQLFPEDAGARHAHLRAQDEVPTPPFLRTLGHFDLEVNGEFKPWKARKVRELLALLLCALVDGDRPGVSRETLTAALWPDAGEGAAEANFRKTLARLRDALGGAAVIEHGPAGYTLTGLRSDLLLFLQASEAQDLSAACAWYGGPFLPGIDLPDVNAVRDALRERWRAAALHLAQEVPGPQALDLLARLLRDDPFDVAALTLLAELDWPTDDEEWRRLCRSLAQHHERELGAPAPELERALARLAIPRVAPA
ncbi:AAA family ATPase [Deinococcus enclensis]|uniref:DNA-binding SARP family transcriptional activator n=1 Tax=Deinococcus enclensis TaxID=1049582 RepID=A0ABT9MH26_9DEIO|nr:AAA family ATPase [Deinococcus enclensis]MDP9765509.1 DNA-binding SARP family transcriptional activator [Deinococcus enclensis]